MINENLLTGIEPEDKPLAELVLFCVARDINLYNFVQPDATGRLIFAPEYVDRVNDITAHLLETNVLIQAYLPGNETRLALNPVKPLMTTTNAVDLDISEIRKYWAASYSGIAGIASTPSKVMDALSSLLANNPDLQLADLAEAAKKYIDAMKRSGKAAYIVHCANFLYNEKGESQILDYLNYSDKTRFEDVL